MKCKKCLVGRILLVVIVLLIISIVIIARRKEPLKPVEKQAFMQGCTQSYGTQTFCDCLITKVNEKLSRQEILTMAETKIVPTQVVNSIKECAK